MLILYPPQLSISELVFRLKGTSSMLIRKRKYPTVRAKLWGNALWSSSYFASSYGGGAPISIIRQYIEQQKTPD
ncbi:IS200/IS605 family transposase [Succinatimonas hippei]|uniref:IS200/IS605 family transposase n=1 Tax=Succinatimonas hippei TaxID=626938 RepID=UPI003C6FD53C